MARDDRLATGAATTFVGSEIVQSDVVGDGPIRGLIATLQSRIVTPQPGDAAPLLAHWLYWPALYAARRRRAGRPPPPRCQHSAQRPAAPDVAGSDIAFHRPLRIGAAITRRSTIADLTEKHGRSGRLLFAPSIMR